MEIQFSERFKRQVIQNVLDVCSKDPLMVNQIIDAATRGVQEFSKKERASSSDLRSVLMDILEETGKCETYHFNKSQLKKLLSPSFEGTELFNSIFGDEQ